MSENTSVQTPKDCQLEEECVVVKRTGKLVPFCKDRIRKAIRAAFEEEMQISEETLGSVNVLTDLIADSLLGLAAKGASLTVEGIQDFIEISLMKKGFHAVAKRYILYRNERTQKRQQDPSNLKIFRQDRETEVRFNPIKIASSIERALRAGHNIADKTPKKLVDTVNKLTSIVVEEAMRRAESGLSLYIADVQDAIEQALMKAQFFSAAKSFIVQRTCQEKLPFSTPSRKSGLEGEKTFSLITKEGGTKTVSELSLRAKFSFAARGLEDVVDVEDLVHSSIMNFYEGMKEEELDLSNIFAARAKIEVDPAYSQVAARLLLDAIYREILGIPSSDPSLQQTHEHYFVQMIKKGVQIGRLTPALLEFDLPFLARQISLENDDLFLYLGLQTLYDRYFIHEEEKRIETPQIFWMRVAMGLALREEKKNEQALAFYRVLSRFEFVSSTPTLFNAGTVHPQLSSCYLSTVGDDLKSIFKLIQDDAMLSKWAGGLGNDWTPVRATGSKIRGTNGESQGVIPFLKVANDTAIAVNQCFAPETLIYTAKGIQQIRDVTVGDLVLGISGRYREVLDTYVYPQEGGMLTISLQDGSSMHVTQEHPFYVKRGESTAWVPAKDLLPSDLPAQIVPQEIVPEAGFTAEDAEAYGAFLRVGQITGAEQTWSLTEKDPFLENYLANRGIPLQKQGDLWILPLLQEKVGSEAGTVSISLFPFSYEDIYTSSKEKKIATRFSHLPLSQTRALIRGMLQGDSSFISEDLSLLHDLKYQYLRLKTPTHLENNQLTVIENFAGCRHEKALFIPIASMKKTVHSPFVIDLCVEGDESYMTTACLAHNGGKRKGAMCAYLETWHLDIEEFLELRKNTGDERRRTHDMNTANWVPDLFMKRVREKKSWTLFSPSDTPDLHDLYGKAFEKRYEEYEKRTQTGEIRLFKRVEAELLWRKMLGMLFETGHPWITFKDPPNIRSSQDHVGVVHSSNLCTEIFLNTDAEEVAVCNLGSINLKAHISQGMLQKKKLEGTVRTAVRMLDNVIDINFYPIPEAKNANLRHRPIGLGMMGFQDALYLLNIPYSSEKGASFADESAEIIAYYAYLASSDLAQERGVYSSYKGSKWDRGILPLERIALLEKERGSPIEVNRSSKMDWENLRAQIAKQGMRNSHVLAIAPTATIANIAGVTQSIEPMYKHLFVKSNLSGEFTIINPYLVERLKALHLWDEEMIDDLKYFDGSIQEISRIPDELKILFQTAFENDLEWIIECAARRQKWVDMGQSLNLYFAQPSGPKLSDAYFDAWRKGLSSTYYPRTRAATQIEKSSTDINRRGLQPRWMKSKSASANIQIERAPSCNLEEGCESCQ